MRHPNPKKTGTVIMGDMNHTDGFGIGQFVNDATAPQICEDDNDYISALERLEEYEKQSLARVNCQVDGQLWFVATRDIKPKEELFAHYGFEFWTHRILQDFRKPESRLLMYALHNQETKPFNLRKFVEYDAGTCKAFITVLLGVSEDTLRNYKSAKEFLYEMMDKVNLMGTKQSEGFKQILK